MRTVFKLLLAAAVLLVAHSQAKAGWFAEITFAPQPYITVGPQMVYRGDWVPYYYAPPQYRPNSRGYHPQYNHPRYQRSYNRPCPRHGR